MASRLPPTVKEVRQSISHLLDQARAIAIASGRDAEIGLAALAAAESRMQAEVEPRSARDYADFIFSGWVRVFLEQSPPQAAGGEGAGSAATISCLIRDAINTWEQMGVPGVDYMAPIFERVVGVTQPVEEEPGHGWNYRVVRKTSEDGSAGYLIREVWYRKDGEIIGMTENPVYPSGRTLEELRADIDLVLLAFERPVLDEASIRYFPAARE